MSLRLTVGTDAIGDGFFHRRNVYVEKLKEKLAESDENLVLILGPRRIGKTSVVREHFDRSNKDENDPGIYIYIYLEKIDNLIDFYAKVIEEINRALREYAGQTKISQLLTSGATIKNSIESFKQSVAEIDLGKVGAIKINSPSRWETYINKLNNLQAQFLKILLDLDSKNVVLGFDEVPETILNLLKNERGVDEVIIWLEHFRKMRHHEKAGSSIKMVLFGSVNMKLTLEKIKQSQLVNDRYSIEIKPLNLDEAKELFWSLQETVKLKIAQEFKPEIEKFLDGMFYYCSPWAIQNFIDLLQKNGPQSITTEGLRKAYLQLFDIMGGVRYYNERLDKYYSEGAQSARKFLAYIVLQHLDHSQRVIEDEALFNWAKQSLQMDRTQYMAIIDILIMDCLVERESTGYVLANSVERNFWYHTLVGPCKFH